MKYICFNNRNIIAILSYQLDSLLACSILLVNKATKLFNKATNSHQSETVGNKCIESLIAFKSKKKKKKLSGSFVILDYFHFSFVLTPITLSAESIWVRDEVRNMVWYFHKIKIYIFFIYIFIYIHIKPYPGK